ncbi:ABC transporter, phosphonate, periplasmic substrate-binding protein [Shimia sp. SK013]|uniref:phosphate/phosphite/phosphonate ABC transporter substrate-binding protein n=1 Tax=Shimia sp. SK013 TaxID=1389006 RepID=UPI0006B3FE90|nr:phosphate/phosphite/phosphonate ABC transporter substrate-binding protein [Shimia sp. SK013]KPA19885.1 ABC transporter, phosphonate, periplasmic substrate-binding protein [Shimia sp. SK013]
MLLLKRLILILLWLLPVQATYAETLVLGSLENDVRRQLSEFESLARYLEDALSDAGISKVEISVYREEASFIDAFSYGDIDLYFDTPVIAAKMSRAVDAKPLLLQLRDGEATYHSHIVVPQNSPVQTIKDLTGLKIAFEEPDSSSGFLMPADVITSAGGKLVKLRSRKRNVPADKIGYVFTGDGNNTMYWLTRGWTDAAALNDREINHVETVYPGHFRVIKTSASMPRQVVMQGTHVDPDLSAAITRVLLDMHQTAEGRVAISAFFGTERFVPFADGRATFVPLLDVIDRLIYAKVIAAAPNTASKKAR